MDFSFQRPLKEQDPRGSRPPPACVECIVFSSTPNQPRNAHGYLFSLGASRSNPGAMTYACLLCYTEFKLKAN
jgi:hypothetical protein